MSIEWIDQCAWCGVEIPRGDPHWICSDLTKASEYGTGEPTEGRQEAGKGDEQAGQACAYALFPDGGKGYGQRDSLPEGDMDEEC